MSDEDVLKRIGECFYTGLRHKAEMLEASDRYRIAECPRCGGRLLLALIGPKNHLRMVCRGRADDPEDTPHCGMNMME